MDKMEETEVKEKQENPEQQEKQDTEEKPRWIDLFERESHRRYQMEYMRDKEYEDIINTLRRGFSQEDDNPEKDGAPYHIPIPAETYFLTPEPSLQNFAYSTRQSGSSSRTYSSTQSVSSYGESTVITSVPSSTRKWLPPEVVERKRKSRRRRTAAYICLGVLGLALVALAVGVILHFLLESGTIGRRENKGVDHSFKSQAVN